MLEFATLTSGSPPNPTSLEMRSTSSMVSLDTRSVVVFCFQLLILLETDMRDGLEQRPKLVCLQ